MYRLQSRWIRLSRRSVRAAGSVQVIQRGVKQRLLKYLAATGHDRGTRRKSSAAGTEGLWAFHHLRIQDTVDQVSSRPWVLAHHGFFLAWNA